MAQGTTQTIATFTGTLLRRERVSDHKLVQLVFREGNKNWLCVSTNPADAALAVGQTYRIKGIFKHLGKRPYIAEPNITPVKRRRVITGNRIIVSAVLLALVGSVWGVVSLLQPSHVDQQVLGATSASKATSTQQTDAKAVATQVTTPAPAAPTPAPSTATAPKKTTTKATTVAATTPAPQAQVQAPAQAIVPDCDVETTPFVSKTVEDDSQVPGTVVQQGINTQTQTCYPNGREQAGVLTVITQGRDEITTVGPSA